MPLEAPTLGIYCATVNLDVDRVDLHLSQSTKVIQLSTAIILHIKALVQEAPRSITP